MQAFEWLHKQGRGHSDVKFPNIRMRFSQDGTFEHLTLVDMGAGGKYRGKLNQSMTCSQTLLTSHICSVLPGIALNGVVAAES